MSSDEDKRSHLSNALAFLLVLGAFGGGYAVWTHSPRDRSTYVILSVCLGMLCGIAAYLLRPPLDANVNGHTNTGWGRVTYFVKGPLAVGAMVTAGLFVGPHLLPDSAVSISLQVCQGGAHIPTPGGGKARVHWNGFEMSGDIEEDGRSSIPLPPGADSARLEVSAAGLRDFESTQRAPARPGALTCIEVVPSKPFSVWVDITLEGNPVPSGEVQLLCGDAKHSAKFTDGTTEVAGLPTSMKGAPCRVRVTTNGLEQADAAVLTLEPGRRVEVRMKGPGYVRLGVVALDDARLPIMAGQVTVVGGTRSYSATTGLGGLATFDVAPELVGEPVDVTLDAPGGAATRVREPAFDPGRRIEIIAARRRQPPPVPPAPKSRFHCQGKVDDTPYEATIEGTDKPAALEACREAVHDWANRKGRGGAEHGVNVR